MDIKKLARSVLYKRVFGGTREKSSDGSLELSAKSGQFLD